MKLYRFLNMVKKLNKDLDEVLMASSNFSPVVDFSYSEMTDEILCICGKNDKSSISSFINWSSDLDKNTEVYLVGPKEGFLNDDFLFYTEDGFMKYSSDIN